MAEHQPRVDFKAVAEALLQRAEALVQQWLRGGRRRGHEWVCGDLAGAEGSSCSVNLTTGAWADFAAGDRGGDLLSLYAAIHGMTQLEAARELQVQLGLAQAAGAAPPATKPSAPPQKPPRQAVEWLPLHPVPAEAPDYRTQWGHYSRGIPAAHWEYRDAAGRLLGVVCRFEASDGSKDVQPLSYCQGSDGRREWRYRAFVEPRPLYGLDRLAAAPQPVPMAVVVEGEKCADALQAVLGPAMPVLAWPGGGNAAGKADWSALHGVQAVVLWPDADAKLDKGTGTRLPLEAQPGMKAMRRVQALLAEQGVPALLVDVGEPGARPDGWDCADAVADGWTRDQVLSFMQRLLPERAPAPAPGAAPARAGVGGARRAAEGASTPPRAGAGQDGPADDWRARLIWRNAWQLLACVPNVVEVLLHHEAWQGVIGFDEFSQRVVKRKRAPFETAGTALPSDEWTDVDDTRAAVWVAQHERFVPNSAAVAEAVNVVARANAFHPVVDWLRGLRWDGTERLDHWMVDLLRVADTPYVRRVSRYFPIGMVMRVLQPGVKFDYCLVLEGRQGRRKSTALRILGGEWFSDIELDLANKDSMSNIRGKWLHEFGEMGSIARTEATRQKSFLSRQVDEFRPSYGRREIRCPRQSAFSGTTNEWAWNKDPTGGRRFWPVEVLDEIDTDGLAAVREQLFAEAYQAALAGERYWPDGDEQRTLFDEEQLAREAPEAYAEILQAWMAGGQFDLDYPSGTFALSDAIMAGLKIEAKSITRDVQTRVGIVLGKLGCERMERRNVTPRFVYKRPRRNAASSQAADAAGNVVEVPF